MKRTTGTPCTGGGTGRSEGWWSHWGETERFRQEKIKNGKIGKLFEILDRIGIMKRFKQNGKNQRQKTCKSWG